MLNTNSLTVDQKRALLQLQMWWNNGDPQKPVFELAGYAGTGKTYLIKFFIEQMKISTENVRFCAFTGKASLVIKMKSGFNATTVHRLVYTPEVIPEHDEPELDEEGKMKKDKDGNIIIKRVPRKIIFKKKDEIDDTIRLIICDECSMISKGMWEDLKSFNVPIIVCGDKGQLPPITGKSVLLEKPDAELEEVKRQGKDSDILRLATLARQGKWINQKDFKNSNDVFVITPDELTDDDLLDADMVLCGKNETRDRLNKRIRELKGFSGKYPQIGEKLIGRKNNYEILSTEMNYQMINGMIGYLMNPIDLSTFTKDSFRIDFKPDFLVDESSPEYFENIAASTKPFDVTKTIQERIKSYGYCEDEIPFEFAYCITTHLSQGSSWKNVIIFDEWLGDKEFHQKWLYTAITRAEEAVILVTKNVGWK